MNRDWDRNRNREGYRGDEDRWRDDESERWRSDNRGMFGYEGEGYFGDAGREPWREDEPRFRDRWSGGEPQRTDRGESGAPGGRGDHDRHVERDREYARRGYNGMPDRVAGGRPLERHAGRDAFSDRGERSAQERESFGTSSFRGVGPRGYRRSDERLHEEVCERLAWDDEVDASEIEVAVSGGTVTLTGTVHDRRMKRRAEDVAERVQGVEDVQNHLHLRRGGRSQGDEPLQSGVLGLTSTENVDAGTRGDTPQRAGNARAGLGFGEAMPMTNAASSAAATGAITNPGAVSTGSSTSGSTSANQGIPSGNTSAGDRARRRNR